MTKHSLKELRQRAHDLKAKGREKIEALKKLEAIENPTEEQAGQIKALDAEIERLAEEAKAAQAAVEAEEKRLERERLFGSTGLTPSARITSTEPDPSRTGGFANIAEFARAVRAAVPGGGNVPVVDPRLSALYHAAPTNYHQEAGGTSGEGYLVPPQFSAEIYELVFESDNLLSLVDSEPTNSNAVEMLADETTPWGASAVTARWRSEASQMTAQKLPTIDPRLVRLYELYAFLTATEELLNDAPRLNARLTTKAAQAISWKIDEAIIYGDGVGKPLGFFSSGALVTVSKESGQAADTIQAKNISKMYSRLLPMGLSRSLWLANSDILPELMSLTLGDMPIWTPPSTGFQGAPGGLLLGRPVRFTEHAKTLGDKGDIMLIDPKGYYAARKAAGVQFAQSMHLYFDYGLNAFRWTFRFGGQPYLSAPVSPKNGSNTKSHFVTLEARA